MANGTVVLVGNYVSMLQMRFPRVSQSQTLHNWEDSRAGLPVYHQSAPRGDHVVYSLGLMWKSMQMLGGANGIQLQ